MNEYTKPKPKCKECTWEMIYCPECAKFVCKNRMCRKHHNK